MTIQQLCQECDSFAHLFQRAKTAPRFKDARKYVRDQTVRRHDPKAPKFTALPLAEQQALLEAKFQEIRGQAVTTTSYGTVVIEESPSTTLTVRGPDSTALVLRSSEALVTSVSSDNDFDQRTQCLMHLLHQQDYLDNSGTARRFTGASLRDLSLQMFSLVKRGGLGNTHYTNYLCRLMIYWFCDNVETRSDKSKKLRQGDNSALSVSEVAENRHHIIALLRPPGGVVYREWFGPVQMFHVIGDGGVNVFGLIWCFRKRCMWRVSELCDSIVPLIERCLGESELVWVKAIADEIVKFREDALGWASFTGDTFIKTALVRELRQHIDKQAKLATTDRERAEWRDIDHTLLNRDKLYQQHLETQTLQARESEINYQVTKMEQLVQDAFHVQLERMLMDERTVADWFRDFGHRHLCERQVAWLLGDHGCGCAFENCKCGECREKRSQNRDERDGLCVVCLNAPPLAPKADTDDEGDDHMEDAEQPFGADEPEDGSADEDADEPAPSTPAVFTPSPATSSSTTPTSRTVDAPADKPADELADEPADEPADETAPIIITAPTPVTSNASVAVVALTAPPPITPIAPVAPAPMKPTVRRPNVRRAPVSARGASQQPQLIPGIPGGFYIEGHFTESDLLPIVGDISYVTDVGEAYASTETRRKRLFFTSRHGTTDLQPWIDYPQHRRGTFELMPEGLMALAALLRDTVSSGCSSRVAVAYQLTEADKEFQAMPTNSITLNLGAHEVELRVTNTGGPVTRLNLPLGSIYWVSALDINVERRNIVPVSDDPVDSIVFRDLETTTYWTTKDVVLTYEPDDDRWAVSRFAKDGESTLLKHYKRTSQTRHPIIDELDQGDLDDLMKCKVLDPSGRKRNRRADN